MSSRDDATGAANIDAGAVARLIREHTPLVDDPAGRAMVRTRVERIASQSKSRYAPLNRGVVATIPVLLLALAMWAPAIMPGNTSETAVPTDGAVVADLATEANPVSPARPGGAATHQSTTRALDQYPTRTTAGMNPNQGLVTSRPKVQLPNRAQAAIVLAQAPAPEALALMQEIQRQRYGR